MLEAMRQYTRHRLKDEAGIHATEEEVAGWNEAKMKETDRWLDALLRRKEGTPREGDTYDFPAHVRAVVQREAGA